MLRTHAIEHVRPVTILAAGGTIAMAGTRATPALDAEALVATAPALADVAGLAARSVRALPGAQLTLDDALAVARAAASEAATGRGVVVTQGTDTLEEVALLADLLHGGDAPVAFTGAIRPASAPGADGPANLLDAVAVAGSAASRALGAVVVFAGDVLAARGARKVDSTSPRAFGAPWTGPLGHVVEGRVAIAVRPARRPPLDVRTLSGRVPIVPVALGDDGVLLDAAFALEPDGVVLVALGAGHVPRPVLAALRRAPVPVVATCRPERGSLLAGTYGFEGAEGDLRAAGVIPAGVLSPQAARIQLLAGLGAGLRGDALRALFAADDG